MLSEMKDFAAIVGVGLTELGKVPGVSSMQLHEIALRRALEDAGMQYSDLDGLITCSSMVDKYMRHAMVFGEYLGILEQLKFAKSIHLGGASSIMAVQEAAMLIRSGLCQTVAIVTADNQLSGLTRDKAVEAMASFRHSEFEAPYGPLNPTTFALLAQRHMHEYGTTSEQFAEVAVAMRRHASLNEKAQMREPITIEDVLNSKMISTPLHILDCSLVSDGGGAVIVTSAERAREWKGKPVYVRGMGSGTAAHDHISLTKGLDRLGLDIAAKDAFRMADLTPEDIDVAELYDCFTISVILSLEQIGFCKPGEGGSFVENGGIQIDGRLPVNTHGGLLSCCHPGYPASMFHLIEGVQQIRGDCGERQVGNARHALVHGLGGMYSVHSIVILGGDI